MSKQKPSTVVVADDDPFINRALCTQLRIAGFDVLVFKSGEELLAGDIPNANACLLIDVYMPAMSGIELYHKLTERGRLLPTILMSARDDQQTRREMRSVRAIATLFKPFDERALLRAIRKALRNRPVISN